MSTVIKLNGKTRIPTDTIKFCRPLTDEDRARIAEKHGANVEDRHIQVTFTDGSQRTYPDTLDTIREQGVGLVNLGNDHHVVAANIKSAEPFTKEDAQKASEGGYTFNRTFRSRVELAGGHTILSTAHPAQVMDRRQKALGL